MCTVPLDSGTMMDLLHHSQLSNLVVLVFDAHVVFLVVFKKVPGVHVLHVSVVPCTTSYHL